MQTISINIRRADLKVADQLVDPCLLLNNQDNQEWR